MTAPLLPLALAFATGVGLGLAVPPPPWLPPVGLALTGLTLLAAATRAPAAATMAALGLATLAGWARVDLPDPFPPVRGVVPGPAMLEGLVGGSPESEGPRTRFPLVLRAVGGEPPRPAAGVLSVSVYGAVPPVAAGDHVRVLAEVRVPTPFRNPGGEGPGVEPRTPRYFVTGRADAVERLGPGHAPWWLSTRLRIHQVLERHLPPVSGALLEGLLVGERRQLPPTLLADFRRAGVLHVLAISGFNVALVAGSAYLLLRVVRVPAPLAATLALATLLAFAAVVGPQPSVLRATVMGGLFLAAGLLGRESRVWNSLAAALLLLLALDPGSLAEPGLQLSFAATAGLLHLGPWLRRALPSWCPRPLADALAVSAGAQLGVTPVALAHWGQLSPLGIVANLIVVPLAGILTTGGVLALALATVSDTLAHLLFQSLWLLLVTLRLVVRAFAALPGAVVYVAPLSLPAVAAAAGGLAWAPFARGPAASLAVLAAVVATGVPLLAATQAPREARVLVLDVGQGEAILVQEPDGQALLVGTGGGGPGRVDRGERVVVPTLRRLGIRRLAALALASGAPDHAGGLPGVLEGLPIGEAWIPAGSEGAPWLAPLSAKAIALRSLARGDRRWLGPLLITALHPPEPGPPARGRPAPLVLRVEWGLFAAVLAVGDRAPEAAILASGAPVAAPVLVVAARGSPRGSTRVFLEAVGPRVAVIPVGARSASGHPAASVLARLGTAGAAVYRTDADGAIEAASDGTRLRVRAWGRPGAPVEVVLRGAP
jgi:competence protein ComEC